MGDSVFMDWLKKAPTSVVIAIIVTCGLLVAVLIAAFVILEIEGADTAEFRQWVNTIGTLVVFPLLGINTLASVSAARSSSRADEQTNGQLHELKAQVDSLGAILDSQRQTIIEQRAQIRRLGGGQ